MKKFLLLIVSLGLFQNVLADPTVAQAEELFEKFSKYLVAGEYEAAFNLRSDPFKQVITKPDGTKAKLEVSKEQALAGMKLLKESGKLTEIKKHEIKIVGTENQDGNLIVTARVTVDPGLPAKAFYTLREIDGKVLIVGEEYTAAE